MSKESDILTIEEVAEKLRISERTVYAWAQRGEIPCGKFGSAWRFRRGDIDKWIEKRMDAQADSKKFENAQELPHFAGSVLAQDKVTVLEKATKHQLLNAMVDLFKDSKEVSNLEALREGIFRREKLMSTGIGMGIAIPHVRLASIHNLEMAAAVVHQGVEDYESLDSEEIRIIFMIIAREDQHTEHLKMLSQISNMVKNFDFRQALSRAKDSHELYTLLCAGH